MLTDINKDELLDLVLIDESELETEEIDVDNDTDVALL